LTAPFSFVEAAGLRPANFTAFSKIALTILLVLRRVVEMRTSASA
jgi:hypothetical protein